MDSVLAAKHVDAQERSAAYRLKNERDYQQAVAASSASPSGRRRSYSAGTEQVRNGNGFVRHPKGEDEPAPDLRVLAVSRPSYIEPWANSPTPPHVTVPSPRTHYFARSQGQALTPPVVQHMPAGHLLSPTRDEDVEHKPNSLNRSTSGGSQLNTAEEDGLPIRTSSHTHLPQKPATLHSSKLSTEENEHQGERGKLREFNSTSPRERMKSPQIRPSTSTPLVTVLSPAPESRRFRRTLEEDPAFAPAQPIRVSPLDPDADIADRMARLESRLNSEFTTISDRLARLEKALGDVTKLLMMQASARCDNPTN